jgi:hypothetical protein
MNEHGMNEHACVADTVGGALQTTFARSNASSSAITAVPGQPMAMPGQLSVLGQLGGAKRLDSFLSGSFLNCRADLSQQRGGAT